MRGNFPESLGFVESVQFLYSASFFWVISLVPGSRLPSAVCWPFAPLSGGCGRCCVRGVSRLSSFILVMSLVISSVAISISSREFALSISCSHLFEALCQGSVAGCVV